MQITRELGKYQIVPVTFALANVAASQTNVQLKDASGQVEGITMPFAGQVVAIAADLSAAATAGSLTVGATIGGTEAAATTQTITTQTTKHAAIKRDAVTFAAGDLIGVEITSSGTWDGTTADLVVTVFVALTLDGI